MSEDHYAAFAHAGLVARLYIRQAVRQVPPGQSLDPDLVISAFMRGLAREPRGSEVNVETTVDAEEIRRLARQAARKFAARFRELGDRESEE